jgi:hypothetical protein
MRGPAITKNPSKRILMLLHLKAETMYLINFHKSSSFTTLTQMIASSEKERLDIQVQSKEVKRRLFYIISMVRLSS